MQDVSLAPKLHLFVCANRRPADAALGPGCGAAGDAVFDACKEEVASRGAFATIWVTKTACLGICPKRGATVAVYPSTRLVSEVEAEDVATLFRQASAGVVP